MFNEALVEEIADHLRHRIHEVRGRVEQMNKVLERSPTAAGKSVELEWQPLDDDAEHPARGAGAVAARCTTPRRGRARATWSRSSEAGSRPPGASTEPPENRSRWPTR